MPYQGRGGSKHTVALSLQITRAASIAAGRTSSQSHNLSKPKAAWIPVLLGMVLWLAPLVLGAKSYSIPWCKIAGGGGTSTNETLSLSGTIGQHDAGGPMTNGAFSLSGGFWVLPVAVQTADAPMLTIAPAAPGYATISWTPPSPGFKLQVTDSLAPTNWVNAASGTNNPATVPASLPARFYRLIKP